MVKKPLPNWIEMRYAVLWKAKGEEKFSFDDAFELLKKKKKDKKPIVSIALSEMRRAGWLSVEANKADTRKRFYKLVPIDDYIKMKVSQIHILKK